MTSAEKRAAVIKVARELLLAGDELSPMFGITVYVHLRKIQSPLLKTMRSPEREIDKIISKQWPSIRD